MMLSDEFTREFEAYVPKALQIAFDYTDASESVEKIWIVCHRDGDWATGGPVFQMKGRVVTPYDVVSVDPTLSNSLDNQETLDPIGLDGADLLLMGDRDTAPTRFVVRYDVAAETVNADFTYEPLRMGPDDTLNQVVSAWIVRLQETGNDSAAD